MNATSKMLMLAGFAAVGALLAPSLRAQSEIAPDHFDSPDMVPFNQPKLQATAKPVSSHYQGKVTLSHRVRCNGTTLAPGNYQVSLRSNGSTVELSLNRRGRVVTMTGTAYEEAINTERGYVVVERRGNARRLSVVHIGLVEVAFAPEKSAAQTPAGPASLEVLPLLGAAAS
jgi:hypothetical protein